MTHYPSCPPLESLSVQHALGEQPDVDLVRIVSISGDSLSEPQALGDQPDVELDDQQKLSPSAMPMAMIPSEPTKELCSSSSRSVPLRVWMAIKEAELTKLRDNDLQEIQGNCGHIILQKTAVACGIADQLVRLMHPKHNGNEVLESSVITSYLNEPCSLDWFTVSSSGTKEDEKKSFETERHRRNFDLVVELNSQNQNKSKGHRDQKPILAECVQCYLFGALLYELFSGLPPFRKMDLKDDNPKKDERSQRSRNFNDRALVDLIESNKMSRRGSNERSPTIADIAFTHAVYLSSSERGDLMCDQDKAHDTSVSEAESDQDVSSAKRHRAEHESHSKFKPLLEFGLPQSLCSLVRNLLKCGWGDFRPDEAYPSLKSAREDLQILLEAPDRFLLCDFTTFVDAYEGSDDVVASKGGKPFRIVPGKLYGRDAEISSMVEAFNRVSTYGTSEAVIISGFSGTGKSQLARCLIRKVTNAGGYVVTQKFDQKLQNQPLSIVLSAFGDLCDVVRQQNSSSELEVIAGSIKTVLGEKLFALTQVIPKVSSILGVETPIRGRDHAPVFEVNNISDVCNLLQLLMKGLSSSAHPVMLVLDDLQWGNASAFSLILSILMDIKESSCFFFVGTYRDNQVSSDHAIFSVLEGLALWNVTVTNLHLEGLCKEGLNSMVSDALCLFPRLCQTLTSIIHHKTKGSPFFVLEFLRTLVDRGLLRFSFTERRWTWDKEKIGAENITDNVLYLLTSKMHTLPDDMKMAMKVASCLGVRLDSKIIRNLPPISQEKNILSLLESAVSESYMDKIGPDYKFVHDKIREAAYELTPRAERDHFHYTLGIQMYEHSSKADFDEALLFIVTDQINYGVPNIVNTADMRIRIAELNLKAGSKSMACFSFMNAFTYFNSGISLLQNDHWNDHYRLSHGLFQGFTKSAYLNGFPEKVMLGIQAILHHGRCLDDKLDAYLMLIQCSFRQRAIQKAFETFHDVMGQLGETLPLSIDTTRLSQTVTDTYVKLERALEAGYMSNHQTLKDKRLETAMHFYDEMCYFSYVANPSFFALCACRMVNITLEHGISNFSSPGFSMFGAVLCSALAGNLSGAYRVAKLALQMLQQMEGTQHAPKVYIMVYMVVAPSFEPLQTCADMCKRACNLSMSSGDANLINTYFMGAFSLLFFSGEKLDTLERNIEHRLQSMKRFPLPPQSKLFLLVYRSTVLMLMGDNKPQEALTDGTIEGNVLFEEVAAMGVKFLSEILYLTKAISSYWQGHFTRARYYAEKTLSSMDKDKSMGKYQRNFILFYHGLIVVGLWRSTPQKKLVEQSARTINKMKHLANRCQWNFQNKLFLLQAEHFSIVGEIEKAKAKYRDAVKASKDSKFGHEQGLSCELAGNFHKNNGNTTYALDLYSQAKVCYEKWGAHMKVKFITQQIDALALGAHKS